MGGFTSQVQPTQVSGPASKGAGISANRLGMNPIEISPEEQLLKTQQLQAEQPNFPDANQITNNGMAGTQVGGLGGLLGGRVTMPGQGGQPKLGMPNAYSNTVQPWDNQSQQPQASMGKGLSGLANQMPKQTGKGV